MPNPPYQWRARWGYIPPTDEQPPSPGAPPPYLMAEYEHIHFTPDLLHSAHHFAPLPNPPWARIPVSAPAYDYGYTYSHPPTSTPATFSSPPSPTSSFWSAPSMYDEDSVPGANPPAGLRDGIRYLYPSKNTTIHVIYSADHTWKNSNGGGLSNFFIYMVPCCLSVRELIEQLGGSDGSGSASSSESMALTEVFETGDMNWEKGVTVKYKDETMGKQALSARGWTERRGGELPPVWVVLHRTS